MERAYGVLMILFSLLLLSSAQVSWFLNTTEARLEETDTIELVCKVTGTCCNFDRTWNGGVGLATLLFNGFPAIPSKYEETIDASTQQFSMRIHNVNISDVNIDYQCIYGFDSSISKKLFMNESIFRYVTKSKEIFLSEWRHTGNLFVTVNLTRVFPGPTCNASYKGKPLTPTITTYDNNLYKYSEIKLQNVEFDCPGTLDITCSVGSYSFPVLSKSPCLPITDFTTEQQSPTTRDRHITTANSEIIETTVTKTELKVGTEVYTTTSTVTVISDVTNISRNRLSEYDKDIIIIVIPCVIFVLVLIIVAIIALHVSKKHKSSQGELRTCHNYHHGPKNSNLNKYSLPRRIHHIHQYRTDQNNTGYIIYNGKTIKSESPNPHVDLQNTYPFSSNSYRFYYGRSSNY